MVKVSVCIQTYNHEPFIAQALDSVLTQETDFDYEIILGEDESQDGTREICIEYARRYPDRIRLFLRSRKDVIYVDGRPTGRFNLVENLKAASGDYIALLEGDDYWTDPLKLQKQVEFLGAHPECAICFHGYTVSFEDGSRPPYVAPPPPKSITSLEDLLVWDFIGTLTVMFRRRATQELPDWYYELPMGDWPLHILNAQHGDIGYIDSVMAVYRVHDAGVLRSWSPGTYASGAINMLQYLNEHLGYRYDDTIRGRLSKHFVQMAVVQADAGDCDSARHYLKQALIARPFAGHLRMRDLAVTAGRLYAPVLYRLGKRLLVR